MTTLWNASQQEVGESFATSLQNLVFVSSVSSSSAEVSGSEHENSCPKCRGGARS